MSDDKELEGTTPDTPEEGGESFAALFESYGQGMGESVKIGDKVSGRIISIGSDAVFVDTGTKIDGVVNKSELTNEQGELPYKEGDTLDLYVTAIGSSAITLSKALSGAGGLAMLQEAFENHVPVEGKVRAQRKGGFDVDVMSRRAFCPVSQIDNRFVSTPEDYVGNAYQFLITKFEEKGRNIVVSRRTLLEHEQKEAGEKFLGETKPGDIMEGKVTRLMPYGAFVEVAPGVEGMVHISEISWSRVENPDEVVSVGDTVRVKLLSVEKMSKKEGMRLSLSMKQVSGDPWETVEGRFKDGDKVPGKVTRLTNFGAFVEIAPGIEGLVHVSELSYVRRVHKPEEIVQPGDQITVKIKELDLAKRRISLSLREAEGDPWAEVGDKFAAGSAVEGTLEKKEQFGWFVNLAPGITGLLPKSRLSRAPKQADLDKLKPGDTMTVVVEEVKADQRKITLGLAGSEEQAGETDWKRFSGGSAPSAPSHGGGLGSLGDKLQAALKAKNGKPKK